MGGGGGRKGAEWPNTENSEISVGLAQWVRSGAWMSWMLIFMNLRIFFFVGCVFFFGMRKKRG